MIALKVRNAPPTFGSPRVAMSGHAPEVIESGRKILQAMNFYGFACTEFKKDSRDGVYKLMEVNGRHNLSSLLAVRCGMNFPWIHYNHLMQNELPPASDYREGVYWIDLLRDVGYSLKSRRQEGYTLKQYTSPYFHEHVFAILDWKDPKPFIKRCLDLVKSLGKAL
jgi:predicted ATP-grasp superfamily ATP-dependent carboligase